MNKKTRFPNRNFSHPIPLIAAAVLALLSFTPARAANTPQPPVEISDSQLSTINPQPLFGQGFSFDLFGAYTAAQPQGFDHVLDQDLQHGKFGAGLGAQYFFTEHFGLGADTLVNEVDAPEGAFLDYLSASGIVRLPLGPVAPYALGGVSRNFESDRWLLHAGAGLEFRFTPQFGAFAEGRYLFESLKSGDNLQLRAGLRFKL